MRFGDRPGEAASEAWQYGPCLYLGPQGQRCDRPARENGFCARHSPEGATAPLARAGKQLATILLLAALLWPLLADFFREITRWIKK